MFKIINQEKKFWNFEKNFLLANFNIIIILEISFLILSNIQVNFLKLKLLCRSYVLIKELKTTKQVLLVSKKEFTVVNYDL